MKTQCAQKQYAATQVGTADRLQLVVMLYEGAISFCRQAQEKMALKDASGKGLYLGKALDIIAELNASLNFHEGKEVAANLFHLYNFMTAHLTRANLNWDNDAVTEVIGMLTQLKAAWEEVCRKARRGELSVDLNGSPEAPRQHLGSLVV
jgi:flagellar secretion chaperone FliS